MISPRYLHESTARCNIRAVLTISGRRMPLTRQQAIAVGLIVWACGFVSCAWFIAYVVIQIPTQ